VTRHPIALVMAGGAGSRMARTTPLVPKPLVTVGGEPLILLTIRRLLAVGIDDIRVAVHHRGQEIIHELRRRRDLPQERIGFIVEEDPLGTIGALAELRGVDSDVLVQNGDLLSGIDLGALLRHHRDGAADLTVATHLEHHRLRLGEVVTDGDGTVLDYLEKPVKQFRISSGTNVIGPRCLELCPPCVFTPFPEFVREAVRRGRRVVEFHHDKPWIDVNDGADLRCAERMFEDDPVGFGAPRSTGTGTGQLEAHG
jgi:NDP-sugar pyrophosphorylase family protein